MIALYPAPVMILLWGLIPLALQMLLTACVDSKVVRFVLPVLSLCLTLYSAAAIFVWFVPYPDLFRMANYSFDAPAAVYGVIVFGLAFVGSLIGNGIGVSWKKLVK